MVYGLMAGLQSVPAFPVVGFVLTYLGWVVTSTHLSVPLLLRSIIVMQLLKDNLGFC